MATNASIVVGGASGIGWATAKALAADGCRVIVADRNARRGQRPRRRTRRAAHRARTSMSPTKTPCSGFSTPTGPLDVVVNCAGFAMSA